MHLKITDGAPAAYSIADLRSDNPGTSFPRRMNDAFLAGWGVYPYTVADKPDHNPATQIAEPGGFTNIDGAWVRGWTVRDKTADEIFTSLRYKTAKEARLAMVAWIDKLTAQVMAQYPVAIQARWQVEEAAARAVKAGTADAAQTALVTAEGQAKGRTPEAHADAIIANADRFHTIAGQINKLFLATDKALTEATDPAQYEVILAGAIAQAGPLATAYGLNT